MSYIYYISRAMEPAKHGEADMQIELTIGTDSLGDINTSDDNQRFADAVLAKVKSEYPQADVSVEIVNGSGQISVKGDETGEVKGDVETIKNLIWDRADY